MTRFVRAVLLFLACVVLCYPLTILVTGCMVPALFRPNISHQLGAYGHMNTRVRELKEIEGKVDILFLGSSHAYRGFDTRNFEPLQTFNLGSSSQTPIQTNVLLKRYLQKIDPRCVVYEVFPETFTGDGVESSLDLISNDINDTHSLNMAMKLNNLKVYNTLLFSFFYEKFDLNRSFVEKKTIGRDTYISGGYVERELHTFRKFSTFKPRKLQFNNEQLRSFLSNLAEIREQGCRLILVYAPVTSALYKSYEGQMAYDNMMRSYNSEYLNFNEMITLDDSLDFYDAHHLNQNGVNKFNEALIQTLGVKRQ